MRPEAEKRIRDSLVLEAVAKAENIEISDDRVNEELQKMAESYHMEVEKLKDMMGKEELEQIRGDLATQEASKILEESAVETEKTE